MKNADGSRGEPWNPRPRLRILPVAFSVLQCRAGRRNQRPAV